MTKVSLRQQLSSEVAGACACQKMREAARRITRKYNDALKPAGIKVTQLTILAVVGLNEGATLTKLSSRLGMDRTTLSRNLGPLERQALIETYDDGYGRARSARLTAKGVTMMETALPLWRKAQRSLRQRLGDDIWERVQTELTEVRQLV